MKRTRLENSSCPIARSLDVIGDWWSLLIVRDALGTRRFSEFQKHLGIAKNMLAGRLKCWWKKVFSRCSPLRTVARGRSTCLPKGAWAANCAGGAGAMGRRVSVDARRTRHRVD